MVKRAASDPTPGHQAAHEGGARQGQPDHDAQADEALQHQAEPGQRAGDDVAHPLSDLGDRLSGDAGSLAVAAAIGVGAVLIEAELLPGILIGAGAVLLSRMFPQVGSAMRPAVKSAVRAGLAMTDKARALMAEAGEQVQDVVAEVRAERQAKPAAPGPKAESSPTKGEHEHGPGRDLAVH